MASTINRLTEWLDIHFLNKNVLINEPLNVSVAPNGMAEFQIISTSGQAQ